MKQKGSTHVQLKHRKTIGLGEICVPQTDGAVKWKFTCQQVVHPTERELEIIDAMRL